MTSLRESLKEHFGFDAFLPGQEAVVGQLMAGRSAAAVFPTGGGKSLCYQLPALLLDGLTLVVSPLIALMKDQIDQLKARGVAAERLDSTLDADEYRGVMAAVRSGTLKLLYVAPERFANERFRGSLGRVPISLFAVDEAHCISEWGHNFRPDYLKLAGFAERFGAERVLALTATATPRVLDDICRGFSVEPDCAVRTGFHRPNLTLVTTPAPAAERDAMLLERLSGRPPGPTIVYVTLQRTAEEVAERLAAAGHPARAYHAGMKDEVRAEVQDAFLASDTAMVVATIAFGMGIDKPNIRYVNHYNLAKSLENLSQEIGRAGRDGEEATCESLVCPDDLTVLENFAYGDTPALEGVRGLVDEIAREENDRFDVSYLELAHRHDVRTLVVRTLLTYLELDGYLEAGTPTFAHYRFRPLATSGEILGRFAGERQTFLGNLFRQAKKARTWFDVDLPSAGQALGAPRSRLVSALDYLAEQELIELKVGGVRHRYRWLKRFEDREALAAELHAKTLDHERREIERLGRVLELAALDGCQTSYLCEYFGETLAEDCGHCGWCLTGEPAELPPRPETAIDDDLWRQAEDVRAEHPEVLAEPRAFSRFLTGLASPRASRARLGRHPLFGALAQAPFPAVLERARSQTPRP